MSSTELTPATETKTMTTALTIAPLNQTAYGTPSPKLTTRQRKALAICGDRLPICDLGKDAYRGLIDDMARSSHPWLVIRTARGWLLTEAGRAAMGRAGKGSTWAKWAMKGGPDAQRRMIDALNSGGCKAGHQVLRDLGL